ncbi:MAG: DUF1800 domain-containing protein [Cyclobacteriaceae bacterium]
MDSITDAATSVFRPSVSQQVIDRYRKVTPPDLSKSENSTDSVVKRARAVNSGIAPFSGEWNKSTAIHLLRRTLFGVKKSELDYFTGLSIEDAVSELLTKAPDPAVPVNDYNNSSEGVEDPHVAFGETFIEAPYGEDYEGQRLGSLKSWLLGNMINQNTSITEKMVLFWHNLLVTESWGVFNSRASYQYFKILRDNAFGNFKTMVKEFTIDPAVLFYLNGNANSKESPDENYARELQELFCVGKGEGSKYTEGDVQAAARVLTGWGVNWEDVLQPGIVKPIFRAWAHDLSDKQFSEFYGNKVIEGKIGEDGKNETDELIDMIFETNEVALYICRRLYNFFIYSEIDSNTEQNVIVPLADIFRQNNYEIQPVLDALFRSEHFFDEANRGIILKNPLDHLIGAWRSLEMQYDDPDDIYMVARTHLSLHWSTSGMGMEIADPPSVAGWPAYYQTPQFDKSWITTDTITSRALRIDSMLFWGFWVTEDLQIKADLIAFVQQFEHPELAESLIADSVELLLGLQLSEEALGRLKATLISGFQNDSYWTEAWYEHINDPSDANKKLVVEYRLQITFQSMLQLGEFQLM